MRHGLTIVPAGLVLVAALLGAGGPEAPPMDWVSMSDARFGMRIMPLHLVVRPDVQLDMQLKPQKVEEAKHLLSRLYQRGLMSLRSKSKEAADAEKRAIDEAMESWFRDELSEAQLERLTQITFQWEGASALRRPSVVKFLGLDEAQCRQVEGLLAERDRRHARGQLTPADFDRFSKQAMAVLTPFQKEDWDLALGNPCRFSIGHPPASPGSPAADPRLKARPQIPTR
jgi:hypothetical protein